MRAPTGYGGATNCCNDKTQRCKRISPLRFLPRCRGAHRTPADILQTFDFSSPKTSLFEGGGPPAGGGRSSRHPHLIKDTRRSKPPVLPPIAYRGFAIAPITLRPPSQRYLLIPPAPRPPSPKTSLFEGGGPPAGGGRSSRHPHLIKDTRRSKPPVLPPIAYRGFAIAPITLRSPSRSPLYNPGCRVATLLVSMGVMGFLGDLRGKNRNFPLIP